MATFKYVLVPADNGPIQELEHEAINDLPVGGNDPFLAKLKMYFAKHGGNVDMDVLLKAMSVHAKKDISGEVDAEMMKRLQDHTALDIFPVLVPMPETQFKSVSLYCDDKAIAKDLPLNTRATAIGRAAGYPSQSFRGDVFFGRVIDDEAGDVWKRADFTVKDLDSEAEWVKQSNVIRQRTGGQGASSLSSMMGNVNGGGDVQALTNQLNDTLAPKEGGEDDYKWTQSNEEDMTLTIKLPAGTGKTDVAVDVKKTRHLTVKIKGQAILEGELFDAIDYHTFTIEGSDLVISLEKAKEAFWKSLFKQDQKK